MSLCVVVYRALIRLAQAFHTLLLQSHHPLIYNRLIHQSFEAAPEILITVNNHLLLTINNILLLTIDLTIPCCYHLCCYCVVSSCVYTLTLSPRRHISLK